MVDVTCFKCNSVVQITPGSERCSVCGEDLKRLLTPEAATNYFYSRAARLAELGEDEAALAETERGIQYNATSDLRLLAAILAQRLSRYDRMRHHVSAIPVDDPLRAEGEWLVRSHQNRQRALREGTRQRASRSRRVVADVGPDDVTPPVPSEAVRAAGGGRLVALASVVAALVIILGAGWLLVRTDPGLFGDMGAWATSLLSPDQPSTAGSPATPAMTPTVAPAATAPATPPAVNLPTPTVPGDVAEQPAQPSPLADSNPGAAAGASVGSFDLAGYLNGAGYPGLALLPVEASRQGDKLVLRGILEMELQRIRLLEAVQGIPGITEVVSADLLVRRPPVYVVQEGDTLFDIVYQLYGNVDTFQEFADFNADVLPSVDALSVGMELKVPPDQ